MRFIRAVGMTGIWNRLRPQGRGGERRCNAGAQGIAQRGGQSAESMGELLLQGSDAQRQPYQIDLSFKSGFFEQGVYVAANGALPNTAILRKYKMTKTSISGETARS